MTKPKTSIIQIADYWEENNDIYETELNFDWGDCRTHCWNCGDDKQSKSNPKTIRLERCHIIPHSLGGVDMPHNYVLLCKDCHKIAPDITNPKYMWEWIKSNKTTFGLTNTYRIEKALSLFKERRGYDFIDIIKKGISMNDVIPKLKFVMDNNIQTHFNKYGSETLYALLCELYDEFDK
jgi:hypothetical protein